MYCSWFFVSDSALLPLITELWLEMMTTNPCCFSGCLDKSGKSALERHWHIGCDSQGGSWRPLFRIMRVYSRYGGPKLLHWILNNQSVFMSPTPSQLGDCHEAVNNCSTNAASTQDPFIDTRIWSNYHSPLNFLLLTNSLVPRDGWHDDCKNHGLLSRVDSWVERKVLLERPRLVETAPVYTRCLTILWALCFFSYV